MKNKSIKKQQKIYKAHNSKTVISINDKILSMQPGMTVLLNDIDMQPKTITNVSISIDGNVKYCLKWFDGSLLKEIWMSEAEMIAMSVTIETEDVTNNVIGF